MRSFLRRTAVWLSLGMAPTVFVSPASPAAQAEDPLQKRVLVLYALRQDAPAFSIQESTYRRTLGDGLGGNTVLDYHSEYLDIARFGDPGFESAAVDFLVRKYRGVRFDLVIANGGAMSVFAAKYGSQLFPGAPVVFNGAQSRAVPNSTGVSYAFEMRRTLDLAFQLQPETARVFVVGGTTPFDKWYAHTFREQLQSYDGPPLTYLLGRPMSELSQTLATLPPRSIILFLSMVEDGAGLRLLPTEFLDRLAAVANAPIYSWNGANLGHGVVGGRMVSAERVSTETAALALRVLRGERPETIPIGTIEASADQADWRQLRLWNIREDRLPAGASVMFRQPGLMEQSWGFIIGTVGLVLLQVALLAGLLVQQRRRWRAEDLVRESEERFRVMADTAPVMLWRSGADQHSDFFNKPWLEFRGRTMEQELGNGWTEGLHPEDRDRCLTTYANAFALHAPFRTEYRLKQADGEYRWILDTGVPRRAPDGTFVGYIGSCIDITERKGAEETLRGNEAALRRSHEQIQDLAGRLITAQEGERARIARELHDDVSQQLAEFSIAISGLKRRPEAQNNAELQATLASLQRRTIDLTDDIRHLSHDLHPSVLQHAGLVDALRAHCSDFAKQHAIEVAVQAAADLGVIDPTTALCLYRITQEALRNIAKHADACHADVILSRYGDKVELSIADDGLGFDLTAVQESSDGLGLRSIEERVRLARGRLSIETAPHHGTKMSVRLDVDGQSLAQV